MRDRTPPTHKRDRTLHTHKRDRIYSSPHPKLDDTEGEGGCRRDRYENIYSRGLTHCWNAFKIAFLLAALQSL